VNWHRKKFKNPFVLGMKAPRQYPEQAEKVFTFRLARDLGMTVKELGERMTVREFAEWMAFYWAEAKEIESARKKEAAKMKAASRHRR